MKTFVLLVALGLLCLAAAKPHNENKRSHLTKRNREHKLTNRMEHGEHHRRDHGPTHKLELHRSDGTHRKEGPAHDQAHRKGGAHRGSGSPSSSSTQHDLKDLHLQHITEHNLEKSHEDKDGIPMESERLIHVTPRPPRIHKVNKTHRKPSPATTTAAVAPSSPIQASTPSTKAKAHKPPKKYSPKKHGWKKSGRKEKGKEKKERRDKRNKALHRAIVARKL